MSIFNADGSMAKQCGNGLRCAAFYLQKLKGFNHHFKINTDSGDKEVNILKSTS